MSRCIFWTSRIPPHPTGTFSHGISSVPPLVIGSYDNRSARRQRRLVCRRRCRAGSREHLVGATVAVTRSRGFPPTVTYRTRFVESPSCGGGREGGREIRYARVRRRKRRDGAKADRYHRVVRKARDIVRHADFENRGKCRALAM